MINQNSHQNNDICNGHFVFERMWLLSKRFQNDLDNMQTLSFYFH